MPNLADVRKQVPEIAGLDDNDAVDVIQKAYFPDMDRDVVAARLGVAPAPAPPPDTGQFMSGFKRSFADLPGLAAGVGAFGADAVGATDTRDKLLAYAKQKNDQEAQDHAGDASSLTDAWNGKANWLDFVKNSAGYVAGQALQSIATGGFGSIGMRMLVKTGAAKIAEEAAAKAITAGASEEAAKAVAAKAATETLKKASITGAAVGAGGHNFGMELGSIYPDAVDQAKQDGRTLDGGDLARVGLSAAAAAGVDTAAEGIMASKILRGSDVGGSVLRRAAAEIPAGMAREAGTEAAQTAIEHYGAGQPIADEKGLKDIIDSAGVGAVGGGLGGAVASLHAHDNAHPVEAPSAAAQPPAVPPNSPTEKALDASAPLDANGFVWTPPAPAETGIAPAPQSGGLDFQADPRFATAPTYGTGEAPPPQQVYGTEQAASMAIGEQGLVGTHSPVAIGPNAWEIRPDAAPTMKMVAPGIYEAPTPGDAIRAQLVPEVGPLSRATNLGLEAGAAHMDADSAQVAAQTPPAPAPLEPQHEAALLDFANQRAQQLETKANGVKEKKTPGPDGKPVITPEVPKQFLTPSEQAEQAFLAEHGGNAPVLATHYSPAEQALDQPTAPAPAPEPVAAPAPEPVPAPAAEAPAEISRPTVPGPHGDQRAVFSTEDAANAYLTEARRGRSTPLIASIKPVQREDGTWMLATPAEIEAGKTYTTKLNAQGNPFPHKGQAMAVAKKIGGQATQVDGGWGVRQEVPPTVNEWQAFAPESGTLGMARADMPQIAAEHRGAMTQFLAARGITHEQAEVDPATLKPTQAEYSAVKALKAREFEGGDRSILVSSDNHVLDGHHQWLAKLSTGEPVKVIRLDAPIAKLVNEVKQFPSATAAEGATKTESPNAASSAERPLETQAPTAEGQPQAATEGGAGRARAQRLAAARTAKLEADGVKPKLAPAAEKAKAARAARIAASENAQPPQRAIQKPEPLATDEEPLPFSRSKQSHVESRSSREVFQRFQRFGDEDGNPRQGLQDAQSTLGVYAHPDVVEDKNLSPGTPAAIELRSGAMHVNPDFKATRAEWSQFAAEEVMHAVDRMSGNRMMSASSPRLVKGGDIYDEAQAAHNKKGRLTEFLDYPLGDTQLNKKRVAAELFARLGVLYHGYPALMRRTLPIAFEAYHGIFGLVDQGSDSFVQPRVWGDPQRRSPVLLGDGNRQGVQSGVGASDRSQDADHGLDALRAAATRVFQGTKYGGLVSAADRSVGFSRGEGSVRSPQPEARALKAISENDELFRLPKSNKDTVEGITADNDPGIKVKKGPTFGNQETYKFTMPTGETATMTVRPPNPYGESVYNVDINDGEMGNVQTERPGENPEAVDPAKGDVWIDVSSLKRGSGGLAIYNIASTYAHNTGRIFIGDPHGLSDIAMRRRPEQMLSSALKFGTTEHLAPHQRQVDGDKKLGVPPLKWVYGDDEGNIRRLIDLNLAVQDNGGPDIRFDPSTGDFLDSHGQSLDRQELDALTRALDLGRGSSAGSSTIARSAVLRALLRDESSSGKGAVGGRDGLLARLAKLASDGSPAVHELFYSRGEDGGLKPAKVERTRSVESFANRVASRWASAPNIVVVDSMADPRIPEAVRAEDTKQRSQGAAGDPEGFYLNGTVYLVASQLPGDRDVLRVLMHESLGHFGLRSVFGKELSTILDRMAVLNRGKVLTKAREYGLDMDKLTDRRAAAEEVLAEMAQDSPDLGWVKRAVAAIRTWLRANVPGFDKMKFSDAELVRNFIEPARGWVKAGEAAGSPPSGLSRRAAPMFSRAGDIASRTLDAADALTHAIVPKDNIVGRTVRSYTPAQLAAMEHVGFFVTPPTLKERAQAMWQGVGKKMAQGLVDQFAPVKDIDKEAYGLLRLSKGASGAFETLLQGGKLKLSDGVYDFDASGKGGVVQKLLIPLQGEHHDFFRWVAANRAERLMGSGKENLFTPDDIRALKSLADGVAASDYTIQNGANAGQVTRDRTLIYADALRTFNDFQTNVLDMAEASGLIDGEARKLWEHEFYVPFYRVEDDGSVAGADIKSGAVRQQAFKSLTGRTNKLNADLLDNTLMNWAHLLDASAKNRAARATIDAAERLKIAEQVEGPMGKGTVYYRENGNRRYSFVNDPLVLTAISSLEYAGMRNPVMNAMGKFKHALTTGVTASPYFKIRNLIRDSLQSIATSGLDYNAAKNIAQGWKLSKPGTDTYFKMLAGGGTIHFGSMMEGSEAKRVQQLVESGIDASTILGSDHKVKAFYRKYVQPGIRAYNELGDRGETINRAALYDQLVKQGISHAEASLMARDLMDFSLQGSFTSVRFLTQVVPFFNARLQGLYKLGRAAKEDPARFAAVIGATAAISVGLAALYADDDDWKKREDFDRNNYWWFKFGGTAFRIPKPFEIGSIATLAERGFELFTDKEMTGQRFREQVLALVSSNLSMNPIPQLVKPMIDVYANNDSFTNRPIEPMSMQKLKADYRFNGQTSMAARGISTALNAASNLIGSESLSPMQVDFLLRGYFGWLGTFVVSGADVLARPATDQPSQPAPDYWKAATGGIIADLDGAQSRYVSQMYAQAKAIDEDYATWKQLQKDGKSSEAADFRQEHAATIQQHGRIAAVKKREAMLNARVKSIEKSDMPAAAKRAAINAVKAQQDKLARALAPVS